MPEKITLELTLDELKLIDKYVDDTKSLVNKIKNAYPNPRMIVENQGNFDIISYDGNIYYFMHYPSHSRWFLKNQRSCYGDLKHITDKETIELLNNAWVEDCKKTGKEEVLENFKTSLEELSKGEVKPIDEVMDKLKNKYTKVEENSASYITDEVVNSLIEKWKENPLDFLKFEMSISLEELITDWWWDVHGGIKDGWSVDSCVADLCERVREWLPAEHSADGSQNIDVITAVGAENQLLQKIKAKLRSKN